jgi:hypothetical protein
MTEKDNDGTINFDLTVKAAFLVNHGIEIPC